VDDQFIFGPDLLIAPVPEQRAIYLSGQHGVERTPALL
jgi:alpha-glucosidase (family GH31 glycosyl hydrolase)